MARAPMPGRIIDGRALAHRVEERVRRKVDAYREAHGRPPQLDVVLVGHHPPSEVYVRRKQEACARVGIAVKAHHLEASSTAQDVAHLLDSLNWDPMIQGILLQLPLPEGLEAAPFVSAINPEKDVDCFHPLNIGRAVQGTGHLLPATPRGVMEILDAEGVPLEGAHAVVVNHSNLVGRPLAALLLQRNATVTVAHKFTRELAMHTKRADILVTATGVPGLITRDHVRPGAVVVDVGISREGERVRGDVRFEEVLEVAAAVTPVPGGVGPMTVAMLLENVLAAAEAAAAGGRGA